MNCLLWGFWQQMFPCSAKDYVSGGFSMDSVIVGNAHDFFPSRSSRPHIKHASIGKLAPSVLFSARYICGIVLKSQPSLCRGISHIVELISEKKMLRIHAWRIITFVKNHQSVWNWAIMQFPRNAVSLSRFSAYIYPSIPSPVNTSQPQPARICFFDFGPESFWNRLAFVRPKDYTLSRHRKPFLSMFAAFGLLARRGTPFYSGFPHTNATLKLIGAT